jgi:hypothetical protein
MILQFKEIDRNTARIYWGRKFRLGKRQQVVKSTLYVMEID